MKGSEHRSGSCQEQQNPRTRAELLGDPCSEEESYFYLSLLPVYIRTGLSVGGAPCHRHAGKESLSK